MSLPIPLTIRLRHALWFCVGLLLSAELAAASSLQLDPGVERALEAGRHPRVLVWIDKDGHHSSAASPSALVDAVLRAAPRLETKILRRFQTVPAFAAQLDARDVEALRATGADLRIGLDVGGEGALLESIPLAQVSPVQLAGFDGNNQKVVIIDSGLRLDHLSFSGRIVDEACFCTTCCPNGQATQFGPGAASDGHGHGTNVAGIAVGAAGVSGVPRGVASGADIVAIRVLDQNNSFCCASDVIAAYDWARLNHPDAAVINASLGTSARFAGDCDGAASFTQAFATVINGLRAQGVLTTVSSGNNGSSSDMQAPACVSSAIAVGAVYDANVGSASFGGVCAASTTSADQLTCFSNLSTTTDLLAPGAPVTAAGRSGVAATSTFSGTSMAAPMTAGCIALLKHAMPSASADDIEAALEASTTRLLRPPMTQDYPRLDCADALLRLAGPPFADGFESP